MTFLSLSVLIRVTFVLAVALLVSRWISKSNARLAFRLQWCAMMLALATPFAVMQIPSLKIIPASFRLFSSPEASYPIATRPGQELANQSIRESGLMTETGFAEQEASKAGLVAGSTISRGPSNPTHLIDPMASGFTGSGLAQFLLLLWAIGGMGCLIAYVIGWLRLRQTLRHCRVADEERLVGIATEIGEGLGMRKLPKLYVSHESVMPMCCGWFRPEIVLPIESEDWDESRIENVLTHEIGHVVRRDLLLDATAQVVRAVYWFHPLAWMSRRRLVQLRELACDELALSTGLSPTGYANDLLQLSKTYSRNACPAAFAMAMADKSSVGNRIRTALLYNAKPASGLLVVKLMVVATMITLFFGTVASIADDSEVAEEVSEEVAAEADAKASYVFKDEGIEIELIAVRSDKDKDTWWTPAGQPISGPPYRDLSTKKLDQSNPLTYEFVLKMTQIDPTEKVLFEAEGAPDYYRYNAKSIDGKSDIWVFRPIYPEQPVGSLQLRLLRSHGQWKKGASILHQSTASLAAGDLAMAIAPPTGDQNHTKVFASIGVAYNENDFRLVALTKDGKEQPTQNIMTSTSGGKHRASISTAVFPGLPIDQYHGIRLETRDYQTYVMDSIASQAVKQSE